MNKKISLGLCLSLVIISVAATFAITMVYSKQIYNSIISNISQRSQSYESAEEINRIISNYFYGDLDEYNNNLSASLGEGYVNGLNDDNSYYMTASEYAAYTEKISGEVTGIGIETAYDYSSDELVITYVYPGSSAESEGLEAGDVITAVGDITVSRSSFEYLQGYFTGSRTGTVRIEYIRDDVTKVVQPMCSFTIPSIITKTINNVGYIKINSFYKNTADELQEALAGFRDSGIESVVFDVRNTSEGTIEYSAKAIDVIVSNINGNIAVARDKNGKDKKTFTAESSSFNLKYAVLINAETSGPAELFACDLRDIKQAYLVGKTTAGVGTMQEVFTLDDGSAILLTTALVVPKNGDEAVYDGVGVSPTAGMEITLTVDDSELLLLSEKDDTQLNAAVDILSQ